MPADVWPDNPEFLVREMGVADWQAHIRDVKRPAIAADVPTIPDAVRAKLSRKHTCGRRIAIPPLKTAPEPGLWQSVQRARN